MKNENIKIVRARKEHLNPIWEIIKRVIQKGDTYVFSPVSSKEKMLNYWYNKDTHTFVALIGNKVVGTFIIIDNFPDLGSHVANASYMVHWDERGKGIGRTMGERSLKEAKNLGYKAMQFNIVVKSNKAAIELWKSLGFRVVGEIPEAFNHSKLGFTDALIMWRKLDDILA